MKSAADESNLAGALAGLFAPPEALPPPPVIIVEQTAFHRLVDDVPQTVADEIDQHPEQYPGVKIVEHPCRDYPLGTLASHAIGHVGRRRAFLASRQPESGQDVDEVPGLMGVERLFDAQLGGTPGLAVQSTDHRGRVLRH